MLYDIYFHNDFDGRASAAVLLNFLRNRGDDVERFVPVGYEIEDRWVQPDFFKKNRLSRGKKNPAIVVDFLFHPGAALWFDHHPTTFCKKDWERKFRPTKFHVWDPAYASACHLTLDTLMKRFGFRPAKHLRDLARWLDIIDGAHYQSAKQTIEMKEPALRVGAFIDANAGDKNTAAWLIEKLSSVSLQRVAALRKVRESFVRIRRDVAKSLRFYEASLRQSEGDVAYIDFTRAKYPEVRFASYCLHPELLYVITLKRRRGAHLHLGLGVNPWRREENRIHIGRLLQRYGGGGHASVGGAEFATKKSAEKAVREISTMLRDSRERQV